MTVEQDTATLPVETVAIAELRPHPRNYVQHPADQIAHLVESIREHGVYKNIVIARDGTILAGHGVVQAASEAGDTHVPAVRLDLDADEPRALKIVVGDNETAHLREVDDRALSELLKEIKDVDLDGLLGTGYDEMMLANLLFVTRPASEVRDKNEAAEWVGMPDYEDSSAPLQIIVSFRDADDRAEFVRTLGLRLSENQKSTWWPAKSQDDVSSVRFDG